MAPDLIDRLATNTSEYKIQKKMVKLVVANLFYTMKRLRKYVALSSMDSDS